MIRKHTAAPWYAQAYNEISDEVEILTADGQYVCSLDCDGVFDDFTGPEIEANAHLIAAAPEMYPFTKMIASLLIRDRLPDDVPVIGVDGVFITQGDVREARRVVAKVEGSEE